MPKDEWGTKRACPKCTIKFYDLSRDPIVCPSCEASFDLATILETYKKPPREAVQKIAENAEVSPILEPDDLGADPIILDEDAAIELEDELLEDDDDGSVSLDELTDVATDSEDS
jgi:uncharacterized protein (TIGR02300 family)